MSLQERPVERLGLGEDWLHTPTYSAWMDGDLLTGDGLVIEIAPESFMFAAEDGLERVRFGRVVAPATEVNNAPLPVLPTRLEKMIEAAEEHPGECVFLEEFNPSGDPAIAEKAWKDYFRNSVDFMATDAQRAVFWREVDRRSMIGPRDFLAPILRFAELLSLEPNDDMGYRDKTVLDEAAQMDVFTVLGIQDELAMPDTELSASDFRDLYTGGLRQIVNDMCERGHAVEEEIDAVEIATTHVVQAVRRATS